MTKNEWLQICRLNQEWYYRSIINNPSDEWIKEHMPDDSIFDDGRIEFFEKNFKKEPIDEEKLDELACEQACNYSDGMDKDAYLMKVAYDSYKAGYRSAFNNKEKE